MVAGPCNHRYRVGNLKTRGPEVGTCWPADPIEKELRNFPADSSTKKVVAVHRTTPPQPGLGAEVKDLSMTQPRENPQTDFRCE